MFNSLSSRVIGLGALLIGALLALAGLLLDASIQTRSSFGWVAHTQQVMQTLDETIGDLREAESGQRGFLLTHNQVFAQTVDDRTREALSDIDQVIALTADNPVQNSRAKVLRGAIVGRVATLRGPLDLGRAGRFDEASAIVAGGRGRELMIVAAARSQEMMAEERTLLTVRMTAAEDRLASTREIVVAGGLMIVGLVVVLVLLIVRGIRRPIQVIARAMAALGEGDRGARVSDMTGSQEFDRLALGYNRMADGLEQAVASRVAIDEQLQAANIELRRHGETLQARGEIIELLGGMAHRMQAARTGEELAAVIRVFVPRVLPGIPGALFAHNNSRNMLVPIASWAHASELEGFAPDDCWALRRGQSHFLTQPGSDIVCAHVHDDTAIYHCEPLLAGGEVIGMLHLQGEVGTESRFRLTALTENIASALVNHRLQRGLREQTIRDPLTSLFNRRYMEETLTIEIARSARTGAPLSLVMCDVDHFKRFNDEFGHDAGDIVLQAVSAEMQRYFRDGDVVCRFGGEEFCIIAPGATPQALAERIERLRRTICELSVRQGDKLLGAMSMSFGIAGWTPDMDRDGSALVRFADAALYRAKREGRNRAIIEERAAA